MKDGGLIQDEQMRFHELNLTLCLSHFQWLCHFQYLGYAIRIVFGIRYFFLSPDNFQF